MTIETYEKASEIMERLNDSKKRVDRWNSLLNKLYKKDENYISIGILGESIIIHKDVLIETLKDEKYIENEYYNKCLKEFNEL